MCPSVVSPRPQSIRKDVGLPAADSITCGSTVEMVVGPMASPRHPQFSAANPRRSGSSKLEV